MVYQLEQFRIFPKEMSASVAPRFNGVFLVISIHSFLHALEQETGFIRIEEFIPIGTPNDFDDVPTGALKNSLQLLNDLSVATHGPIEALQIAINDPDEVIQVFPRREGERAKRFGFVR